MKLLSLIFLLATAIVFPQTETTKSIQELKNSVKDSEKSYDASTVSINSFETTEKKSVGLGIIYSLLLPGMGELYADAYNTGKYFTIADGVLWGTLIGMSAYSNTCVPISCAPGVSICGPAPPRRVQISLRDSHPTQRSKVSASVVPVFSLRA